MKEKSDNFDKLYEQMEEEPLEEGKSFTVVGLQLGGGAIKQKIVAHYNVDNPRYAKQKFLDDYSNSGLSAHVAGIFPGNLKSLKRKLWDGF